MKNKTCSTCCYWDLDNSNKLSKNIKIENAPEKLCICNYKNELTRKGHYCQDYFGYRIEDSNEETKQTRRVQQNR